MILYSIGAVFVFGLSLQAFLKDKSTAKTDRTSWFVLLVATLAWPIVLPSILVQMLKSLLQRNGERHLFTHADGAL